MNKTINQLNEIASAELTDEAVIFDLSDSDTKKMTMQKAFNTMHKLSSTSVADSADELALYDSANNVTKKITKQNLLSEIQPPIIASSATINGPAVEDGLYIKVIFTSAISGSDTVTPFEITYNGNSVPVKVMKSGVASDILAHEISSGVYSYLQAMVTFEMVYSSAETAFILVGNPIVLSDTDYTIYADGQIEQHGYSTNEIWTGKYWTDGRKIYRKSFSGTEININAAWGQLAWASVADLNIDQYINCFCLLRDANTAYTKGSAHFTVMKHSSNNVVVHSPINSYIYAVTIEYVKVSV